MSTPPPPLRPFTAPATLPVALIVSLAAAAAWAGLLPEGRWNDALALAAGAAALLAGHDRRDRDMVAAGGLAMGLAPAGWLLAPLMLGMAMGRATARRHLPLGLTIATLAWVALPWTTTSVGLPNLAALAQAFPSLLALVVALGVGVAAWLTARASVVAPAALFVEARLGVILLAGLLPLPVGVTAFVLLMAILPLPTPPRLTAANDNAVYRPTIRLAA